jgi:hypothetical protein
MGPLKEGGGQLIGVFGVSGARMLAEWTRTGEARI